MLITICAIVVGVALVAFLANRFWNVMVVGQDL